MNNKRLKLRHNEKGPTKWPGEECGRAAVPRC